MSGVIPARLSDPVVAYAGDQSVTHGQWRAQVEERSRQLPPHSCLINLCQNRLQFALTLQAGEESGKLVLLPSSPQPAALTALLDGWPHAYVAVDRPLNLPDSLGQFDVVNGKWLTAPTVPDENGTSSSPGFMVYTSGSSGVPQRHFKRPAYVRLSAKIANQRLTQVFGGGGPVVGTSPFQHMYGLESTVFLPLQGFGPLTVRQPLFPADLVAALDELPLPALLVTTPFHLSKILESTLAFPPLLGLLSATAPLPLELAQRAEARFGVPLMEIYGSTETGQLASRCPTRDERWQAFDGIQLYDTEQGIQASGGHLEQPQRLNDHLVLEDARYFRWVARHADMVCVAGKRSSLAYLTHCITSIPGVEDGVVCLALRENREIQRVRAFAVSSTRSAADILGALRQIIDPVFLPRPLVLVKTLPRDDNGKITAATLTQLCAAYP